MESKAKVLNTWGVMPDKDENEEIFKIADYCDDGDEFRVEAMIAFESEFGIYYMLYGQTASHRPVKLTTSATLSKTITGVINTTRDFKVPFGIVVRKGTNPSGQEYTAGKVVL